MRKMTVAIGLREEAFAEKYGANETAGTPSGTVC
jgi:hypothetical protein